MWPHYWKCPRPGMAGDLALPHLTIWIGDTENHAMSRLPTKRRKCVCRQRGAQKLSFKPLCSSLFFILSALLLRPRARQIAHSLDFLSPSRIARKTLTQTSVQFYKARYQKPFRCALLCGRKEGKRNSSNFIIKESKH